MDFYNSLWLHGQIFLLCDFCQMSSLHFGFGHPEISNLNSNFTAVKSEFQTEQHTVKNKETPKKNYHSFL